jgi:hypothetical protein
VRSQVHAMHGIHEALHISKIVCKLERSGVVGDILPYQEAFLLPLSQVPVAFPLTTLAYAGHWQDVEPLLQLQ